MLSEQKCHLAKFGKNKCFHCLASLLPSPVDPTKLSQSRQPRAPSVSIGRSLGPGVGRHSGRAGDMMNRTLPDYQLISTFLSQRRPDYCHVSPDPPRPS